MVYNYGINGPGHARQQGTRAPKSEDLIGTGSWDTQTIRQLGLEVPGKYFIEVYTDYYRFNPDTISNDFPDTMIKTLADLSAAIMQKIPAEPLNPQFPVSSKIFSEEEIIKAGIELPNKYIKDIAPQCYIFAINLILKDFPGCTIQNPSDLAAAIADKNSPPVASRAETKGAAPAAEETEDLGTPLIYNEKCNEVEDYIRNKSEVKNILKDIYDKAALWHQDLADFDEIFEKLVEHILVFSKLQVLRYNPLTTNIVDQEAKVFFSEYTCLEVDEKTSEIVNDSAHFAGRMNFKVKLYMMTPEELMDKYALSESDYYDFFTQGGRSGYSTVDPNACKELFGRDDIYTIEDLFEAFKGELNLSDPEIKANMGNFDTDKFFEKYIIRTGQNKIKINFEQVEKDFPGENIRTLSELKAKYMEKELKEGDVIFQNIGGGLGNFLFFHSDELKEKLKGMYTNHTYGNAQRFEALYSSMVSKIEEIYSDNYGKNFNMPEFYSKCEEVFKELDRNNQIHTFSADDFKDTGLTQEDIKKYFITFDDGTIVFNTKYETETPWAYGMDGYCLSKINDLAQDDPYGRTNPERLKEFKQALIGEKVYKELMNSVNYDEFVPELTQSEKDQIKSQLSVASDRFYKDIDFMKRDFYEHLEYLKRHHGCTHRCDNYTVNEDKFEGITSDVNTDDWSISDREFIDGQYTGVPNLGSDEEFRDAYFDIDYESSNGSPVYKINMEKVIAELGIEFAEKVTDINSLKKNLIIRYAVLDLYSTTTEPLYLASIHNFTPEPTVEQTKAYWEEMYNACSAAYDSCLQNGKITNPKELTAVLQQAFDNKINELRTKHNNQ